jgi:hypothetical protein
MNDFSAIASPNGDFRVRGKGVGFVLVPHGAAGGSFPLSIEFEGNFHDIPALTVRDARSFYFDRRRGMFDGFFVTGATPLSTWIGYVFESADEGVGDQPPSVSTAQTSIATETISEPTPPTLETEGVEIQGDGIRVFARFVNEASPFDAAGSFEAHTYNPNDGMWYRNKELDLTVADATDGGLNRIAWGDLYIPVKLGRIAWRPRDVESGGASAGDILLTYLQWWKE